MKTEIVNHLYLCRNLNPVINFVEKMKIPVEEISNYYEKYNLYMNFFCDYVAVTTEKAKEILLSTTSQGKSKLWQAERQVLFLFFLSYFTHVILQPFLL